MIKKQTNFARPIFILLLCLTVIVVATVMKVTSSVLIPLTIAMLISLVFEPIIVKLNKKFKIPWAICIVIVLLILFVSIYAIITVLTSSIKTILSLYPKYEERFMTIYQAIAEILKLPFDADNSLIDNLWGQLGVRNAIQGMALSLSSSAINILKDFVMICLFAVFFLLELRFMREKIEYAIAGDNEDLTEETAETTSKKQASKERVTIIITDIIQQVTKYISTKFFISILTGILVYIAMIIINMDFPIIWAFIAVVLNFIPNFGSIISVLFTTIFSLVQFFPQPGPVIYTAIIMTAINFTLGNIVEPRVQGKNLGLSPFVIIASLSLWGWLWGFTGLILAVPMMVIVKIICENFSLLHPVSIIIGSWPINQTQRKKNIFTKKDEPQNDSEK